MKKSRIFPKIIYYFFTFSLGILLALMLPYYFMYYDVPLGDMEKHLESGEYDKAMELVGGYFNRVPVYSQKFDEGGGLVLFEAATPVYNSGREDDKTTDESKLQKTYAGFIYGVRDTYQVGGENGNQTKLLVVNLQGKQTSVELLDYDIDDNKIKENVGSLMTNGFIYVDLDQATYGSLSKLTFLDKNGYVFQEADLNLAYDGEFFADVNDFVEEYNRDFKSDKLAELDAAFRAKSENYAISSYGDVQKRADTKATIIVVVYFVCIYIIGDFLVGQHYVLRFFRWIFRKAGWVKKKKPVPQEAFGHDYYSQVTVSLDVTDFEDFGESVQLRYNCGEEEATFTLLKENGYSDTQRIKAGTYVNAWMDINRDYAPTDMPENLIVEGYSMSVKIKIIKRKEEESV
ncbi:MAG: hypothetical protein NC132_06975 [Corallococcus sp.]|nr:hypothetical protein [Corallococcus sp.]